MEQRKREAEGRGSKRKERLTDRQVNIVEKGKEKDKFD